jgi:hypothetical protein
LLACLLAARLMLLLFSASTNFRKDYSIQVSPSSSLSIGGGGGWIADRVAWRSSGKKSDGRDGQTRYLQRLSEQSGELSSVER